MTTRDDIIKIDRSRVWHPYTSIDAWAQVDPIVVDRAQGSYFWDKNGKRYIDGNASWWVAALGHGHPRLLKTLREQSESLAHCALAGITHEPSALLAEELIATAPAGLSRVFYTDNGSTSIEVALKIALQYWQQTSGGNAAAAGKKKTRFIALDGAFHGDSLGAMSLGGVDVFTRAFSDVVFDCVHAPFPSPDAYARAFETIADILRRERDTIAAVFVESMVQGAAGMRMYEPRFLNALRDVTRANDVLLITDEVFSGYGRTGKMWASEHAGITPDVMCLGKAFSAMIPMAATLVGESIIDAFRGGEGVAANKARTLYYGHTFCGNPLGAALAREVLAIYRDEKIVETVATKHAPRIESAFTRRIANLPSVERVRTFGMIGAADLKTTTTSATSNSNNNNMTTSYFDDVGWRVYEEAKKRGAYLRPLGNTVYVTPPLNISDADLDELLGILEESIRVVVAG